MHRDKTYACYLLLWAYKQLRATDRGKHLGYFSYYHVTMLARLPEVKKSIDTLRRDIYENSFEFNVVKLNRYSRISFLRYQSFDNPFPILQTALSCDLVQRSARYIDFTSRLNPPILHRRELLLPENDPRVVQAARLTDCLEQQGAFHNPATIGTLDGWRRRLRSLGIKVSNDASP